MNYNEALTRNVLLSDLREVKGIQAKAMTEILLLRVHYGKIANAYQSARQEIDNDKDADEDAKAKATQELLMQEVEGDRKMSQGAFEQVVESAMQLDEIKSWLFVNQDAKEGEDKRAVIPTEEWLTIFAGNLVE